MPPLQLGSVARELEQAGTLISTYTTGGENPLYYQAVILTDTNADPIGVDGNPMVVTGTITTSDPAVLTEMQAVNANLSGMSTNIEDIENLLNSIDTTADNLEGSLSNVEGSLLNVESSLTNIDVGVGLLNVGVGDLNVGVGTVISELQDMGNVLSNEILDALSAGETTISYSPVSAELLSLGYSIIDRLNEVSFYLSVLSDTDYVFNARD